LFGCKKSCGCDSTPACGCEAPACGCAEPACGCEPACGGCAEPACGCEASSCCDSGCGRSKKHCGLLSKLFACKKSCGCDTSDSSCGGCDTGCSSGCGSGSASPMPAAPAMEAAPMAPTPVVDPSASYQSKRRVIQASARYVR